MAKHGKNCGKKGMDDRKTTLLLSDIEYENERGSYIILFITNSIETVYLMIYMLSWDLITWRGDICSRQQGTDTIGV